jgi:hypothetical protein
MGTIVIHMGAAKTGTSSLQSAFAKNVDQFLEHNIAYPHDESLDRAKVDLVTSGNGVGLAKMLGANLGDNVKTDSVLDDVKAAAELGRDVLFSSEAIGLLQPGPTAQFREIIKGLGFELRVIVYFRSIADHAASLYQQHIKEGSTQSRLADFIRHEYGKPQTSLAGTISKIFDASEIVARNYDIASGNLLDDFLTGALNLTSTSGFATNQTRVNRSLTPTESALMRIMGPIFKSKVQARVASDAIINGPPQSDQPPTISTEAMRAIEELHSGSLEPINSLMPRTPIGLKSDKIVISDQPEPQLSEAERVLAAMIAGIIRSADLKIFR